MLKWNCKSGCCDARSQQPLLFYTKNTPRSPCGERGAKTKLVFTAARSLQSRSYAAGGARYLQADLMLLTHAGCAFKDPRGRFGISYPAAVLRTEQSTAREVKSDRTRMANAVLQHITCMDGCVSPLRTAALRSNRRYGAAALLHCGAKVPLKRYPLQENAYLYSSTRRVRCS
jgi:hypothetical protein